MTEGKISLRLKNRLSELNRLCDDTEEFGKSVGLPAKIVFTLTLSLEELVTNVISYGYRDDAEHLINLDIAFENGVLEACLVDDGIAFNPLEAPTPDCDCPLEERKIGKLGIHLTKEFMDDLVYERRDDKNILIIRKKIEES
jgi:anti-sigma regulatory factor (Ser/Thr protein kinase)